MQKAYTLYELNEYIRRVLALNFPAAVWVRAEIAQINHSRGHYFLTLVQKEEEGESLLAQSEAVIWERAFRRIHRMNGKVVSEVLRAGMAVKLQARVDFNERYGLKLIVEDLDPAFTMGELELQKRAALERLQREGLLALNRTLELPAVLQRIAVLSSPDAAGLQDFVAQLEHNKYGYAFHWRLFPIAVQGRDVAADLKKQLRALGRQYAAYDCAVLIRGGGGRTDLAAFDQYEVGAELARCPLPLLTGIGHEVDETVADLTACRALKTPTAVAEFLIQRNLEFENALHHLALQLQRLGLYQVRTETLRLNQLQQRLSLLCQGEVERARTRVDHWQDQIPRLFLYQLEKRRNEFERLRSAIQFLDPEQSLRRGYSLTYCNGRLVRSATDLRPGDQLTTRLPDGTVTSTVNPPE